ncbi:MAG: hypothetical protein COX46_02830 [bacterium (Candidatus Ratteibacteria) CG23_combo_of_CG06-09_8_20_14_all_48_7]|uniref:Uncharacterized protein n=1 Tax=bacterium (Candidatus Ratteibacteria) CG23_combo_of_CG06-09_8_20_14_all_48_7 TaxID=2014292 RepID=A0A2G9YCA2_9BACT|nr:MAG: hypothetical protein COX46_02830 [bacterium (Candidatus Ratteibacteria) CG23_combo_of_CG06-09_8_20_14_all_48_7]
MNENWFLTIFEAREIVENWRIGYNQERPLHNGPVNGERLGRQQ